MTQIVALKKSKVQERNLMLSEFVRWMDDNVGEFKIAWYYHSVKAQDVLITVNDPDHATLMKLVWGGE